MGFLDGLDLMTPDQRNAKLRGQTIDKVATGQSRLDVRKEEIKADANQEPKFKAAVWKRDKSLCRCCGRKVEKKLELAPDRGEVNHLHGRLGKLRYEVRAALLMCAECHEELTGTVGRPKLVCKPTRTFRLLTKSGWKRYTDARYPVIWRRVPPRKEAA